MTIIAPETKRYARLDDVRAGDRKRAIFHLE